MNVTATAASNPINWDAIGVAIAIAALAVALYQVWRQFSRSKPPTRQPIKIHVTLFLAAGTIPDEFNVKINNMTALLAEHFLLKNLSNDSISKLRIRITHTLSWSERVTRSDTLPVEAYKLTKEGQTLLIEVEDFPSNESFEISLFSNASLIHIPSPHLRVRAENSVVKIVSDDSFEF